MAVLIALVAGCAVTGGQPVATDLEPPSGQGRQRVTAHTLALAPEGEPASAGIAAAAWLTGAWRGRTQAGRAHQVWMAPADGVMSGHFRFLRGGELSFFELATIDARAGTLQLKIRHFEPDLRSWEGEKQAVRFALVAHDDNALYFEGMTFARTSPDTVRVYLARRSDGETREHAITYRRSDFLVRPR